MRAVVQRVNQSSVTIDGELVGEISKGLNVLLGVEDEDTNEDIDLLVDKVANLRVFEDSEGKMNLSVRDINGDVLVVSQFTLLGDCRKGRRPSFIKAAPPERAEQFYKDFVEKLRVDYGLRVETGGFQEHMMVNINNDGPVTLLLDSNKVF